MSASTTAVAQELVALCREGKNMDAINRLYSPDIVSIEPMGGPDMPAEMKGIDAIRGKNEWWLANHEVHSATANGPFIGDKDFVAHYIYDVTFKPTGKRMQMKELALYTVKDGKVVREEFFYHTGG